MFDLENEPGLPIYVHSKVCVVDDVWLSVGSDNLNRRSWTHDSELSCALLDERLDERRAVAAHRPAAEGHAGGDALGHPAAVIATELDRL